MKMKTLKLFPPLLVLVSMALLYSCSGEEEETDEWTRLLILEMDQEVLVSTSTPRVNLVGTHRVVASEATVTLDGTVGEREVRETLDVSVDRDDDVGDLRVILDATEDLWPALSPINGERFRGTLIVEFVDVLGVPARGALEGISWLFVDQLRPDLMMEPPGQVFANARLAVTGDGILRPEEGQTVAVIDSGELQADRGHSVDLDGEVLPVAWTGDRSRGELILDPGVIGVHPGTLDLNFRFENRLRDGTTTPTNFNPVEMSATLDRTFIANVHPNRASRGELIRLDGRGFVADDAGSGYGMVLRFEGTLTPADTSLSPMVFEGAGAPERVPFATLSDQELVQEVWYDVTNRQLTGLGAVPGEFDGRVTPIVYDSYGAVDGVAWEGNFEVLPTRQLVYLKYLPAFSVAINRYGLHNVEREVRQRIFEVVRRDYQGVNIEFVEEEPNNFARFATVELGGPDPTGRNSFGFDNTYNEQAKDTGNLHIDDYLGGINPDSGEMFNNPYGGVFVESFAIFSPTIHPEIGAASEEFDRVFGPFMPELGGQRVLATEWPEGPRTEAIEEAIRVFGNVVGNTVSHELGHAMGLAHFHEDWDEPGHRFHNRETDERGIMDPGVLRSFEQRAELNGQEPAGFNTRNRAYLEQILPLP